MHCFYRVSESQASDICCQVSISVRALDIALDGVDCSLGSNPLMNTDEHPSAPASSSLSRSASAAIIVSITQNINGLLNAVISPSPITIYIRPSCFSIISFVNACVLPLQEELDAVHNYRRKIALQLRPQILAALSTPDDIKVGIDFCVVFSPGLDETDVGLDVRARADVDLRVHVGDVRFTLNVHRVTAAAAAGMAAAAAGMDLHSITHHIASVLALHLSGSMSGNIFGSPSLLSPSADTLSHALLHQAAALTLSQERGSFALSCSCRRSLAISRRP
jgi:hypothetical protein